MDKKRIKRKILDILKKEYANIGGMSKSNRLGGGEFPSGAAKMEPLDHITNKYRDDDTDESKIGTNHFSGRRTDYHSFKGSKKRKYDKTNFDTKYSGQDDIEVSEEGYLNLKQKRKK